MYSALDKAEKFEREWPQYERNLNKIFVRRSQGKTTVTTAVILGGLCIRIRLIIRPKGSIDEEVFAFKSSGRSISNRALHAGLVEETPALINLRREVNEKGNPVEACKKFLEEFLADIERDPAGEEKKMRLLAPSTEKL
ncbi:MAG: hypothetical protein JWL80_619 [Parcubacteria group bacterium]|nr:hypothetical protein [Parcubacteria group bacterium]